MFRIDKENDEAPLAEVTFEKGTLAGQTFTGDLVPCRDLTCECDKIYVRFKGDDQTYDLWLDTYNRTADATGGDEQVASFAGSLTEAISPEGWDELKQLYYVFKLAGTEMIDPSEIKVNFDRNEVEEGVMFNYNELLPYGLQLAFTLDDIDYEADTLYCVRPNCGCTAMNLAFHAKKDGEYVTGTESPVISYDYVTRRHVVESRGQNAFHTPDELLTALKAKVPALDKVLKERHQRFKTIYKSYLRREGIVGKPRRAPGGPVQLAPTPKVAGRNDPCPCGSGKKYKKCGGA